nr:DUF2905 domain-containing protein [Desulfobacterales bacterium]
MGRLLIVVGLIITGIGLILSLAPRIPWLGKLPGDIYIQKEHFQFYFPITTCIIVSIILTLLFSIFKR